MSFVSGVPPEMQGEPVQNTAPQPVVENDVPYLEIPEMEPAEPAVEESQPTETGEPIDYRSAYEQLQSQNVELQNRLGAFSAQQTVQEINGTRDKFDLQQTQEWSLAESYAATMKPEQAQSYLNGIRAKQLQDRSGFEDRVRQVFTMAQKQHEDRLMTSAWMDELQRRHGLTNQQKMMLSDIDPRKMEAFAVELAKVNGTRTQGRRTQAANERRQSGVDSVVQDSRPAMRRVRADSNEAFIALAGDLLK